jgi:large subunit ribosomal protein L4
LSGGGASRGARRARGARAPARTRRRCGRAAGARFGPKPRDYRTELPKKQRRAALAAALSQKAGENAVTVIDALKFEAPKTKRDGRGAEDAGLGDKRTLLVIGDADPNVVRSCRNLRNLHTTLAQPDQPLLSCFRSEALLVTAPALAAMKEIFAR